MKIKPEKSVDKEMEKPVEKKYSEEISEAQLEKLKFELREMKRVSNFGRWTMRNAALISTVLTIISGFFIFYQYIDKERKQIRASQSEQYLKIQERIRGNLELLLQTSKNEELTAAKATLLLYDLQTLIKTNSNSAQNEADAALLSPEPITAMLVNSISFDRDFKNYNDVKFTAVMLTNWEDFKPYLVKNPVHAEFILSKYRDALGEFYDKDPSFFKTINFDNKQIVFNYPEGYKQFSAAQGTHIQDLIWNYKRISDLLEDSEKKRTQTLWLQVAVCNQTLVEQLFGYGFDANITAELKHCIQQ